MNGICGRQVMKNGKCLYRYIAIAITVMSQFMVIVCHWKRCIAFAWKTLLCSTSIVNFGLFQDVLLCLFACAKLYRCYIKLQSVLTYSRNRCNFHFNSCFVFQGMRRRGQNSMSAGSEHTIDGLRFEGEVSNGNNILVHWKTDLITLVRGVWI